MKNNSVIQEVLEKFYIFTNVPIQLYSFNKEMVGSVGLDSYSRKVFKSYNILDDIDLNTQNINQVSTRDEHIHFTVLSVSSVDINSGVFIIGPYSSVENTNFPYKSLCLSDYMARSIRMLWKEISNYNSIIKDREPYSFHVKKALDYIDSKYREDFKLNDVADYLNINKSYFCSILKKETGFTFTQYLNNIRIEKSKYLLVNENYSVMDIALSVGFNNQNYYNIIFKKLNNVTPLEYRNQNVS